MASKKPISRAPSNAVEDSETNVQVILRCRPPSQEEVAQRAPQVIKCDEASREVTLLQNVNGKQFGRTYHFDKVFAPDTTQERLYDTAISSIVEEVLQGFNCTIFAYGQTGTGKTHTMTGDLTPGKDIAEGAGVIPRAMKQIFTYLNSIGAASEYTVKCCFLELYNEEITDLLAMGSEPPKVRIMEDRSGVVVQGLEEPHVKSASEIFSLLETGNARRRTAETLLNKQSSRSHSVFIVTVSVREVLAEGEEVIRVGKLYLVDLAGSENVSRSGAVDQRAKEAGNINKSLLTLGRVITALVEGQGHVPYRDSKLTRLLRDSLGGRTKTCIIATIAPTVQCQEETLSTLDYAHRAKNIKNKPEVNQKISKTTHLKELNVEIARLKAELVATREKNGVYLPLAQYEEEKEERRLLAARVEELEEDAVAVKAQLDTTRLELAAAKDSIAEREYMLEKHRHSEASLVEHAGVLTDELTAAVSDVAMLFTRVDAKNIIEDKNVAVVNSMKNNAVEKLAGLKNAMSKAVAVQVQLFDATKQSLDDAAERKHKATTALQERIDELQSKMLHAKTTLTKAIQTITTAGKSSLSVLNNHHVEYVNAAQSAAVTAMQELEAACSELTTTTAEEQQRANDLLTGQKKASAAIEQAITTIVSTIQQQLEETQQQVLTTKKQAEESLARQTTSAETLEHEFIALARQQQASLVEQMTNLIAGFVDATEKQVKKSISSMKKDAKESTKALQGQFGLLIEQSKTSIADMTRNVGELSSLQQQSGEEMTMYIEKLRSAMDDSIAAKDNLKKTINVHAAAASNALSKHNTLVTATIKHESNALDAAMDTHIASTIKTTDDINAVHAALHSEITTDLTADTTLIDGILTTVNNATTATTSLNLTQDKGLTAISNDIQRVVDDEYVVDGDRHAVPSKRKRDVPTRDAIMSLVAPSAREMAREYRAGKAGNDSDGDGVVIDSDNNTNTITTSSGGGGSGGVSDGSDAGTTNTVNTTTIAAPLRPTNTEPTPTTTRTTTSTTRTTAIPAPSPALVKSTKKRGRPSSDAIDAIALESPSKVRVNARRGGRRTAGRSAAVENDDE